MGKKFNSVEERRSYWREWYQKNKHREDYKAKDIATKKRLRKERLEWWLEYKKQFKCERCKNDDTRVLDFHHEDAKVKEYNVSEMACRGLSKETIMKELEKCVCLCSNCHRILHYEERNEEKEII